MGEDTMAHRFSFNYVATKNDEFNLAIGVASGRWSHIEAGLCLWFKKVTKMPHTMARSVFYSVSGFDGRRRMFQGAIGNAKIPNELRDYLNLLTSKAGNYSGSRNRMAHGDPLFINRPKSKHHGTIIILEGQEQWKIDPPEATILTLSDLQTMAENFRYLAALIADSLSWPGADAIRRSSIWSPLARGLPYPAHSKKLDPTIASQIRSIEPPDVDR
jgi:hypothetical protein